MTRERTFWYVLLVSIAAFALVLGAAGAYVAYSVRQRTDAPVPAP